MHTTVKFAKVRPTAKIPAKRMEDAGYDIYADFEEDYIGILPHETKLIPTGIACACDTDYCLIAKERGSTGSKGMAIRCGVIDSGYRDEIFIAITNTTQKLMFIKKNKTVNEFPYGDTYDDYLYYDKPIIYPYEKAIAQLLVVPVPTVDVEEISYEELKQIPSERGAGKIGSSGK